MFFWSSEGCLPRMMIVPILWARRVRARYEVPMTWCQEIAFAVHRCIGRFAELGRIRGRARDVEEAEESSNQHHPAHCVVTVMMDRSVEKNEAVIG